VSKNFGNKEIKNVWRSNVLIIFLDSLFGLGDHIMLGKPQSFEVDTLHQLLLHNLNVVNRSDGIDVKVFCPFLLCYFRPDAIIKTWWNV
jgi:hypothetical protein